MILTQMHHCLYYLFVVTFRLSLSYKLPTILLQKNFFLLLKMRIIQRWTFHSFWWKQEDSYKYHLCNYSSINVCVIYPCGKFVVYIKYVLLLQNYSWFHQRPTALMNSMSIFVRKVRMFCDVASNPWKKYIWLLILQNNDTTLPDIPCHELLL